MGARKWSQVMLFCVAACGSDDAGSAPAGTTAESTPPTTTGVPSNVDSTSTPNPTTTGSDTADAADSSGGPAGNPLISDAQLNIAHRGGALLAPEETLVAFETATAAGADVLEFDVHLSADGVVICSHDDTVDRMTDGTGAISDMTLDELQQLDAGYSFTTDDGATYPYRGMGVVLPTMAEVLAAHPDGYFVIEIKQSEPPMVDEVLDLLDQADAASRVIMASFETPVIEDLRSKAPDILTSFTTTEVTDFVIGGGDADYVPPGDFLQIPTIIWSEATRVNAAMHGLKIHVWTINDPAEMEALLSDGADGIMTDDPATLATLQ